MRRARLGRFPSKNGLVCAILLTCAGTTLNTFAQVVQHDHDHPSQAVTLSLPDPAPDLRRFVDAVYWTAADRARLRVEHGLWEAPDLREPALAARAALLTGRPSHAALLDEAANPLDRADAMLQRGELQQAIEAVEGDVSLRAARIRAQALELMGQYAQADQAVDPVVQALIQTQTEDADELVDGVLALMVRGRVRGPSRADDPGSAAADFRTLMRLLARSRDELARQSWRSRLVEAQLLYEKSNYREAGQAASEALLYNPKSAEAWMLLGTMHTDQFAFDQAEGVARVLDSLHEGISPDAAILRSRIALRQNDLEGASAALSESLEQLPHHRGLLVQQLAVIASTYDQAALEEALAAFDTLNGAKAHHAHQAIGVRMSEARQYEISAQFLREAIERQPMLAESWSELGLMSLQAGRDQDASDALREAVRLDPFNTRSVNSLALIEQLVTWPTVENDHFKVRYREGIDEILAREMLPVLEEIHQRVAGPDGFDHEPQWKTLIELMPDHATFAVRITGMPALHTVAAATGPTIAMESPQEGAGFTHGTYDWPRVLQHEYGHTVTLSRTRNRIPHWFTEAAAVWVEDAPRPWGWWTLLANAYENNTLFPMNEISLRFVRPIRPSDRTQAYAQGHWMYEYMVEAFGNQAPLQLMDHYAKGTAQNAAMQDVIGQSESEFFEGFLQWAGEQLEAAGLKLKEGVPSLAELAKQAGLTPEDGDDQEQPEINRQTLTRWLKDHPTHPELLAAIVQIDLEANNNRATPAMVPLLRRLAAARPVDPVPHRQLARLALEGRLETGDDSTSLAAAIEHLEFLDAQEMGSPVFARALAERYAQAGDMTMAWTKANRAVAMAPFNPALRELAATVAVQTQQWDEAERMLLALTRLEPDRPVHQRRLEALRQRRGE